MKHALRPLAAVLVALAVLVAASAVRAAHSQLAAQWSLDAQTDGTTPDGSGHGLTGVDVAGTFVPGRFGNALSTAGDNEGFRVTGDALLEPQRLTVVAWVKKGAPFDPYRQIVSKGGAGCSAQSWGLSTGVAGGLWWNVRLKGPAGETSSATTSADAVAPGAIWDDQWHAIAGTFDGSTATLYVDGAAVGSAPVTVDGSMVDYDLVERRLAAGRYPQDVDPAVGPCDPAGFQFRGAIDEIRVYQRALGAAEIAFLHSADHATPPVLPEPGPEPTPETPPPAPENTVKPEIRSAPDGAYTCDPGTWANVASPPGFGYRWLAQQGENVRQLADTQSYSPAAEVYGYPVFCQATVAGPTGPVTATSPRVFFSSAGLNKLPPAYGDVRIRGIDVFQVVQPKSGAPMFRYSPDGPFADQCGAGTPTSWRVGPVTFSGPFGDFTVNRCDLGGRDAQYTDYEGVVLDRYKPTMAVVYVDVADAAAADASLTYDLELSATRAGAASLGAPVVVRVRNPPRSATPFVLPWERDGSFAGDPNDHGIQVRVPSAWISGGGSIRLEARLRFPERSELGTASYGTRQCDTVGCEANDVFRLNDVPFADYPQLILRTLQLRRIAGGQAPLPAPGGLTGVLAKALRIVPGGSRMVVSPYSADLDITTAATLTATAVPGPPANDFTCNGVTYTAATADQATRTCRDVAVTAIVLQWITDNPARPRVYSAGTGLRLRTFRRDYDAVMGVHDYDIPVGGGTVAEPGAARNNISTVDRTHPRQASDTPVFTATSRTRPLTSAAHELGHILTAPHAGQACPVAVGQPGNLTGPGNGGNTGEAWAGDDQGRLQSVRFVIPPRSLRGAAPGPGGVPATVDGPYQLRTGATFDPNLFDLMSYCADLADTATANGNAWLSARNWNRFSRELGEVDRRLGFPRSSVAAARSVGQAAQASTGAAFAVGLAVPGSGKIERIVPPDGEDAVPASVASSPFRLRSLGPGGRVLRDAGVEVRPSSESSAGAPAPFTGPVAPGAIAVELVHDGRVLDRIARSRPPRLRLLAPGRGTRVRGGRPLRVRWLASDPDRDPLAVTVDFSDDGGITWRTVQQGRSSGRATIPGRYLSASRRARVRVSVSDGFSERTVASRPFRAEGTRPRVQILSPEQGALVRSGERVTLTGSASDDRGRPLPGRTLTWFADRRRLGRGARLRTALPRGTRRLRLMARDRAGRRGVATLRLRVATPSLRIVDLQVPLRVRRSARAVRVRIRASAPAVLSAAGRRFRIGRKAATVTVRLPRRPVAGEVKVPFRLSARGRAARGTIRGTFAVVRI